jgi:3-phenylpropionate/cinnamic acid dioxygenase small subunit
MSALAETPGELLPGGTLYAEVLTLLYREADLLDNYRFAEWLEMMAPDLTYAMPVRTSQFLTDGKGFDPQATFFDDDLESLTTRVKRLETEFAWAETPPSRTRHFISNTILEPCDEGEARARSHFMVTRTRSDNGYQMFTGERQDTLRRADDGALRFARRVILPDQTTITATNLSVFL